MKKLKIILMMMLMVFVVVGCSVEEPQDDVIPSPGLDTTPSFPDQEVTSVTENLPELVATVNGEEITKEYVQEMEMSVQQNLMMAGMVEETIDLDELVEQTIMQRLLVQLAHDQDYGFSKNDVEEFFLQQGLTTQELQQEVNMMGLDYDEFLYYYVDELTLMQFVTDVQENVEVTTQEVQEFYNANSQMFDQSITYEEIEEDLYYWILEQKSNELLMVLIDEKWEQSNIEIFY